MVLLLFSSTKVSRSNEKAELVSLYVGATTYLTSKADSDLVYRSRGKLINRPTKKFVLILKKLQTQEQ